MAGERVVEPEPSSSMNWDKLVGILFTHRMAGKRSEPSKNRPFFCLENVENKGEPKKARKNKKGSKFWGSNQLDSS